MKKILFIILLTTFTSFSQESTIKKADKYYTTANYMKSAEMYSQLLEKESSNLEYLKRAADSYYFISEFEKAIPYLKILVEKHKNDINDKYVFKYAQALKASGNKEEADKWLKVYQSEISDVVYKANVDKLEAIKKQEAKFTIENAAINSEFSEFGPTFYKDKLVFSAPSKRKRFFTKKYTWTNQQYLDLYSANINLEGKVDSTYVPFSTLINSKFHEATAAFSEDGKTIYFTRNNSEKGKRKKDDDHITNLGIYKAELFNDEWINVTPISINSVGYSVMHPSMDYKNKRLYFSSDMPGSMGSFDIFYVTYDENGNFGKPINAGTAINTKNREQFPYVNDTSLYFASDGHVGFGLLDIFVSEIKEDSFTTPLNLGMPVNTISDDFSYIINAKNRKGFFASNRENGKGDDDIYSFIQIAPLETFNYYVDGQVLDNETLANVTDATVKIFNDKNNLVHETNLGEYENFIVELKPGTYKIEATHPKYIPAEKTFTILDNGNLKNSQIIKMQAIPRTFLEDLIAEEGDPKVITDNGVLMFNLPEILFDFNKFNIRGDAEVQLNLLVEKLNRYPQIDIEIGAHTDIRGTDSYNEKLSQERATATMNYLIEKGVDASRISAKGYGESKPKVDCMDHECSDDEHQINRRSEFVIIVRPDAK